MFEEKIAQLRERNEFLNGELIKPEIAADPKSYKKLAREQNELPDSQTFRPLRRSTKPN